MLWFPTLASLASPPQAAPAQHPHAAHPGAPTVMAPAPPVPTPATPQGSRATPSPWSVSGSLRARAETLAGQFRPGVAPHDDVLTTRFTLAVGYDAGRIRYGAELFDSRAFGQDPASSVGTGEVNALELVQAYADIDLDGDGDSTLRLGRMTMDIGSKRLVSRQNFRNTTNAYTGARLSAPLLDGALTAFWVLPQSRLPDDRDGIENNTAERDRESPDLQFFGASWSGPAGADASRLEIYAYGLTERDGGAVRTRDRRLVTPGLRWRRPPAAGQFDFEVEAAGQFGTARRTTAPTDVQDLDVLAGFVHAEIGRTFDHPVSPRLSVHYDQATGDEGGNSYGRFDFLYGARRFEFGPAGLYGPVSRQNLISTGLRFEVKPSKRLDGFVMARGLWLDSPGDSFGATGVRDPAGRTGRVAGQQIEGRVRYALRPETVWLEVGAARLFKGRVLEAAPNAPDTGDTIYGYADVTVSF